MMQKEGMCGSVCYPLMALGWHRVPSLTCHHSITMALLIMAAGSRCCLADAFPLTTFGKQCLEAFARCTGVEGKAGRYEEV